MKREYGVVVGKRVKWFTRKREYQQRYPSYKRAQAPGICVRTKMA